MEKEPEAMDQHNLIDLYLNDYEVLYEYRYPNLNLSSFSFKKYRDPKNPNKYIDDGVCEVCGKRHQYVLVAKKTPKMCYRCYQSIRAYKSLLLDVLKLRKKENLTLKDCKKIVKYMQVYSKAKLLALATVGTILTMKKDN